MLRGGGEVKRKVIDRRGGDVTTRVWETGGILQRISAVEIVYEYLADISSHCIRHEEKLPEIINISVRIIDIYLQTIQYLNNASIPDKSTKHTIDFYRDW